MSASRLVLAAAVTVAALGGVGLTELWHRIERPSPARRDSLPFRVKALAPERARSDDEPPDAGALRLCQALHELPGRRAAECCGSPPSRLGFEQCVQETSRALARGSVRLDPSALAACAEASESAFRGCDWVGPRPPMPPAACSRVIAGVLTAGARCRSSLECEAPLHCAPSDDANDGSGRCRPPEPLGRACSTSSDVLAAFTRSEGSVAERASCESGFCSSATRRCETPPAEGSACKASINCAAGQRCQGGTCQRVSAAPVLARAGQACQRDFDCETGGCVSVSQGEAPVCAMSCPAPSADLLRLRQTEQVPLAFERARRQERALSR